jgi:hypothetical protein
MMLIATPAAACWTPSAASAAKVRNLETMLMVSALRCRTSGRDILPQYNHFVRASRPALTEVNNRLRQHFETGLSAGQAMNAYDRYVTSIANHHGGGTNGLDCTDMASILSAANKANGNLAVLERIASDVGIKPDLKGGVCSIRVAAR